MGKFLPDFNESIRLGFQSGREQVGENPLGSFIKNIIAVNQQKKATQEEYAMKIGLINTEAEAKSKYPSVLEKAIASQAGGDNIPGLEDMEIVGYDQKGNPMLRKVKRNVQGEKFDLEQEEKIKQQEEASSIVKESAQDTLNTIKEVEDGISNFGLKGVIPALPGTKKANWQANVDKLLSGKIIDVMTSMKKASKTGATGFGQLSNKELEVLRQSSTQLKKTLNPKDAKKYLKTMKEKLQKIAGENDDLSNMSDEELLKLSKGA